MQVTFQEITLRNFLSFGNSPVKINLNTEKTTLIVGNNRDIGEGGISKNGVGKSSIFQALVWSLYNEGISNIKQDGFINLTNEKNMVVELVFSVDSIEYKIVRGRKPNILEIYRQGDPLTAHSMKNTDDIIVDIIGMDFNTFMNTIMLTNSITGFMNMKGADQRDFLESLFAINVLSDRADKIKLTSKENEVGLKSTKMALDRIKSTNATTQKSIESLKIKSLDWAKERNDGLEIYQNSLEEFQTVDVAACIEIIKKIKGLQDKFTIVDRKITEFTRTLENGIKNKEKLEHDLKSLMGGKCPFCEQIYVNEGAILTVQCAIDDLDANLEKVITEVETLLEDKDKVESQISSLSNENPDLMAEKEYAVILNETKNLQNKITELSKNLSNPFEEQIIILGDQIKEEDEGGIKSMEILEAHFKILVKLLTDSKSFIRKSIIDQYIPLINQKANEYISMLASPHKLVINNDLSVDIVIGVNKILSYGNLSAGERLRVNLGVSLAFRDFLQLTNRRYGLLLIDELFDAGGDSQFCSAAMILLKKLNQSVFIISHKEEMANYADGLITVSKSGGFSTIDLGEL